MDLTGLQQIKKDQERAFIENKRHAETMQSNIELQETVVKSFRTLVDYLNGHTSKTEVVNQLKSIATPDVVYVVEAVNSLHETLKTHENTDLTEVTELLKGVLEEAKAIPKQLPETPEQQFVDYTDLLKELTDTVQKVEQAVKAQETTVEAPVVNVPETVVNVPETDLKPLEKGLEKVEKAVKGVKIPEVPETNLKPVEKLLKTANTLLQEIIDKPSGGSGGSSWVAVDNTGNVQPLQVDGTGALQITGSITASASTLADFSVNDIEEDTTSYFGYTKPDGTWLVKSLTDTSVGYATVSNNGTVTSYTDAWTNRAALTFERFDEAF